MILSKIFMILSCGIVLGYLASSAIGGIPLSPRDWCIIALNVVSAVVNAYNIQKT